MLLILDIQHGQLKVDIMCDSTTVLYTDSLYSVFTYDLNTSQQKPKFTSIDTNSNYRLCAFKIISDTGIEINMTGSGDGPKNALCLNSDGTTLWTDEVNPIDKYRAHKRRLTDGSNLITIDANVNPASDTDDKTDVIYSLGSWYHFCHQVSVISWAQTVT